MNSTRDRTQVIQLQEEVLQLRSHSELLLLENDELQKKVSNSLAPDYEATRDRTLDKLRMGRQSAAGKAIEAFIKELQRDRN